MRATRGETNTEKLPADSTLDVVDRGNRPQRGLWMRRATVAVMVGVIVVAGIGFLGVKVTSASAEHDGYRMSIAYAAVARAGLDVPLRFRIQGPGLSHSDITLAVSADYFRMFETQGFFPAPSSTTSDSGFVYLTFDPPRTGDELVIDYDAYIQPSQQHGKSASVRLLVDGTARVSASIRTRLLP